MEAPTKFFKKFLGHGCITDWAITNFEMVENRFFKWRADKFVAVELLLLFNQYCFTTIVVLDHLTCKAKP